MRRSLLSLAVLGFVFAAVPAAAQTPDPQPGDACPVDGRVQRNGGAESNGAGHTLVCISGAWQSAFSFDGNARSLFQVNNDPGSCTSEKDGRIRYLSASDPPWEYCDGGTTSWLPFKQPRCQDDDTGECYLDATRSNDDPEFAAANIADGINILGVTGTLAAGGGVDWPAAAQGPVLNNPDPTATDNFSSSVAVSGNIAVVGAPYDDPGGVFNAGTAYVFDVTNGDLIITLENPDPTATDNFGTRVAVSGNIAVVSAPQDDPGGVDDAGTAYVFDATDGSLIATLDNPAPTSFDYFGLSAALDGSIAVVGASRDDPGGVINAGTAYVFDVTDGSLIATLDNPDPVFNDWFGSSVAVSGNLAVISAPQDAPGGVGQAGTAYVFDVTDGSLLATLDNPDPATNDYFGWSVAVSGDIAVVGAYRDAPGGVSEAGTAYVFDVTDGSLIATLDNPDPAATDRFGNSVAIDGDIAVVGAYVDDPGGVLNVGTAYVFDATGGSLLATLDNPEPAEQDWFGNSVTVSGNTVVIGVYNDDPGGVSNAGTAYVFTAGGGAAPACTDDDSATCTLDTTRANDDPDFTAANIADGVNILGVTGTLSAGGGCTAPASCTSVGDVCSDGSIFAGFMVYNGSCEPLYVTDNNQSTSSQWKTATGTNDITDPSDKNDAVDGQYNRDNRGGGTFPAFELCENNTYHGKNDWYLPARAELNLLWLNQAAIDANAAGNFLTLFYWSSTEFSASGAWYQYFGGGGSQAGSNKTSGNDVRCVRRD